MPAASCKIGHGVSSRSSQSNAAGRITLWEKSCAQSRSCCCSSDRASENVIGNHPFVSVLPVESSDWQPISLFAHCGVDMLRSSTTTTVARPELFNAASVNPTSELDGLGLDEAQW